MGASWFIGKHRRYGVFLPEVGGGESQTTKTESSATTQGRYANPPTWLETWEQGLGRT